MKIFATNLQWCIATEIISLQAKLRVAELKEQHRSITANLALYPSTQSVDMATLTPDDAASIPTLESDAVSHIATVLKFYNAILYYKADHIAWNPMSNFHGPLKVLWNSVFLGLLIKSISLAGSGSADKASCVT